MPPARALRSVAHNFLGTFMSRYTDFDGYWLFGFIVERVPKATIDLLDQADADSSDPVAVFRAAAQSKFQEQLAKAGFGRDRLSGAELRWLRSDLEMVPSVWGPRPGYKVTAEVLVGTVRRQFSRVASEFILAHNPDLERRSGRVA